MQAVLLGSVVEIDWTSQGVPSKSQIEAWPLSFPLDLKDGGEEIEPSLVGDGRYLYVHGKFGLMKVGTGYGNTKKVRVILVLQQRVDMSLVRGRFISAFQTFTTMLVVGSDTLLENSIFSQWVKEQVLF